jgi:23S rRNA (cytidine1920-2'-O)/16S rRNA (cytidine1409-2'-O)-methyltransferase
LSRKRGALRTLLTELARRYPELEDPASAIARGGVLVDGFPVRNVAARIRTDASLTLSKEQRPRGAAKLCAALQAFDVEVRGRVAVDTGAAAGGFTRVLLEAGAARVYAVDAGFGQLPGSLRQDERVVVLERVNVAQLDSTLVPELVEVITIDLSYLAIARAAPQLQGLRIADDAECVALVKPMYELRLAHPPADEATLHRAVAAAAEGLERVAWRVVGVFLSPEPGSRGAIEFFLHARRAAHGRDRGGA